MLYDKLKTEILDKSEVIFKQIDQFDLESKIDIINKLRILLHKKSPFKKEPVDCVLWVKMNLVEANDYNPNIVAPPEMTLLKKSIKEDGYTQPIVSWEKDNKFEVVDGFHRNKVGKENRDIKKRIHGYLPLSIINAEREEKGNRIASTIRHNRARGKHTVDGMAEIVIDLKRRNWSPGKIGRELGMDQDEVLRLTQITGLAEMFADKEFSEAWEADISESDIDIDYEAIE